MINQNDEKIYKLHNSTRSCGLADIINHFSKLKNKRVVLTKDLNSTETKLSYDMGGPLPPTNAKNTNAATIQTILDT
jgi:hypothetical protein